MRFKGASGTLRELKDPPQENGSTTCCGFATGLGGRCPTEALETTGRTTTTISVCRNALQKGGVVSLPSTSLLPLPSFGSGVGGWAGCYSSGSIDVLAKELLRHGTIKHVM